MYISLNWLHEFIEFSYTPAELEKILTMLGIEVDSVIDYGKKYQNFIIAHIDNWEKHPDADKLSICTVSTGENKPRSVICGAPNAAAGQKVVLGIEGAIVPQNSIEIAKRKIRGVESQGMICSQFELELGDDKSGIWVLPNDAPIGTTLAEYINLNDIVFEIGITPNRADCLSHLGIAREISAYSGDPLKMTQLNEPVQQKCLDKFEIIIEASDKCTRYVGYLVENVKAIESPLWLRSRLNLLGMRPINAIVDVTNFVMLECGQPLHAFDSDLLSGRKIIVKNADDNTQFTTLDNKERNLDSQMLMICDGEKPVAIAGVMGGQNSEINDSTTNILIESAHFVPSSIRRTSKKLALQSESSYRFERGTDPNNALFAAQRAANLIAKITGGTIKGNAIDIYPSPNDKPVINVRFKRVNDIIGTQLAKAEIIRLLTALNFELISQSDDSASFSVPSYRVDIESEIDLIEEIARLYNYDNLEPDFVSSIDYSGDSVPKILGVPPLRRKLRNYMVHRGFNETITQNMLDPASSSLFAENVFTISNPLGDELSTMRPSLLPAMLRTIERNIRFGEQNLRLFEIGHSFVVPEKNQKTFIEGIFEKEEIIIAVTGNSAQKQWSAPVRELDFFDIKGIVTDLLSFLKLSDLGFTIDENNNGSSQNGLQINAGATRIGFLGELAPKMGKLFGLETAVYFAIIDLSSIYELPPINEKFKKVSPYPASMRDLAFIFDKTIPAQSIYDEIIKSGGVLLQKVEIFDVFDGGNIPEGKRSIAFSLVFGSAERTLVDEEVDTAINKILSVIDDKFSGEIRKA
ncbi:MAG: Phenylalanyl-tRNA synthetase subunit beta [Ignavibacteria bacterium]|nr:Phenylalanyl-tRNA synthetase subunit beta [Ignavibacteria bacterium]